MASPATIDLTSLFADLRSFDELDFDDLVVAKVTLFPDEDAFRVIESNNAFNQLAATGGTGNYNDLMLSYVHPDDRDRLSAKLASFQNLPGEVYAELVAKLMEAASARPTESPSASRRLPTKK